MNISETETQPFARPYRRGGPCPALSATRFCASSGGGAGYDISQSTSESAQQGSSIASPFSVGGGFKVPNWAWAGGLVLVVFIGFAWAWKKFIK